MLVEWEILAANDGVYRLAQFASDSVLELGVATGRLLEIRFSRSCAIAEADDVDDGVAFADFLSQHFYDLEVAGLVVRLLEGVAAEV